MSRTTKEEAQTIIGDLVKAHSNLDDAEYTAKNYVKDLTLAKKLGEIKLNVKELETDLRNKLTSKQG